MARKHEHFGLSYLEELNIVKERENICKESKHEFMKFKQEFTSDHGNVNKALQEVTPSSQSLQIHSKTISPFLCSESKQLSSELDISGIQKKVRIACDEEEETIEIEDTPSQPKKSSKKQNHTDGKKKAFHSGKAILEHKSESPGDEVEKMPVLIASFVGTTKQMTILKKPGPLKPKSPKIPCAKLRFKGQSKDSHASSSKPLEQKILSQHIVLPTAGTSSADFDDTSSVISSVHEKSMTISKEDSESNVPSCLERSYSTKGSASSSIKFAPAHLEETISESRLGLSKSHLKSFSSYSKSQASHSISKLPSGIVSRSIDEIIESLKSTVPTDSDLKIKELLESILGQDYLIKIQQSAIRKEMQPNELELPAVRMAPVESDIIKLKPSHIRKDRSVSPSAYQGIQLIPEDSEQEIAESSQARSISYSVQLQPSEMREHIAGIEVANGVMPTATEESDYVFKTVSPEQQSIHESENYSFSEIEETPESIVERSKGLLHVSTEEKLEDFASSSMGLIIQGKAFPKARPVEIQKSVEDLQYQQPVSLLSTWTTKIKEVDYPLIHLLCTTSPGFVLPSNLRLVSRVHHTIDKAGHGISLPPINFDCHNSEGLFPVTAAFEEQIYRESRLKNVHYNYNDGKKCDKICIESLFKPLNFVHPSRYQMHVMKLQPGSLKMFWTPAPHKFSAPLSVMKEILFSKYESNLVHGVIYEDFSIDLQEKEKAEDEDDVDYLFSNISANGRCGSFPELAAKDEDITHEHLVKRPNSAPELSSYRDKTLIKISANFKTVMEELDIMSKHVPLTKPKAETSPEKGRQSPTANLSKICFSPSKPPVDTEKVSETIMGNTLRLPKGNLFEVEPPEGLLDQTALADKCRKAGINYIIFPKKKRKSKKVGKSITPKVLDSIFQKLNEPPKVLKRLKSQPLALWSNNPHFISTSTATANIFFLLVSLVCFGQLLISLSDQSDSSLFAEDIQISACAMVSPEENNPIPLPSVFQAEGIPKAYLGAPARHWYHQQTQHSKDLGINLKTPSSTFDLNSPPYKPLRAQFYGVGLFHNVVILLSVSSLLLPDSGAFVTSLELALHTADKFPKHRKCIQVPSAMRGKSVSLTFQKLKMHNKYSIKVSRAIQLYRSPSLPCLLNFETFAKKQGKRSEDSDYLWTRLLWNKWFEERFVPIIKTTEDKQMLGKHLLEQKIEDAAKEKELPNYVNPFLFDGKKEELAQCEREIERITQEINTGCATAFNYCRRGAIYRKIGKMQSALDDLEKVCLKQILCLLLSFQGPALVAFWLLHLQCSKQVPFQLLPDFSRTYRLIASEAGQCGGFSDPKSSCKHCLKGGYNAYLSRAQIYRKQGKNHLAMINYTLALRYRPTDPEIYYKRGEVHEEEGELILAMEDYSKCLYYDPQSVDACMKHGIYYFNKSNWTVAMNNFTTVIKKDPKHAEARTYRARIYIKQEQYKNAAEDLSAAIHLNPRNWIAFYYRGCILRKIDPKQSLQDLSVSVLLNHKYDNIGAYLHRGILYAELKQWPLAICDFENAIALDRSLTTPYINIGLITMLHSDQYFDAILRFTEAIRVDPLDVRPYLCRAQAYQKVHDLRNSVKDINRAIHLHPNLPHLFLTRGQYLLQMKHFKLASFCIHQVAEMDKGTALSNGLKHIYMGIKITLKEHTMNMCLMYGLQNYCARSLGCSLVQEALVQSFCQNYNKAIECAIAATRNQPEPALYNLLGKIQMKAKKFKDALSSLNEALMLLAGTDKCLPNTFESAELYFLMGQCYMEQVFLLEACDAFTSAVRLYPRYADAFYQRGLCRMQLQQAKCILDFNKTLAIVPRHFQAYISRAAYYGSKGRYSKAIMNCTEALKIEPCSVRGYLYRGVLKFYNRTYKHAVEDLTKAIKLDKMCTLAYYNRAIAFQQLKDYEHSLIDYETVLRLETNKDIVLKVLKNRALVYIEMKRYDYALKDFAEVAMIEQKNTELLNAIGLCYHRLQKYEEAVESFSKVLKLNPFVLDAYIGRGNAYLEYGHSKGTRQALKDFLTAVHINPVCIKARLCLGYSLQALGKFQKAWTQFSAAIHCDPSCHIAYDGRAIVCLQMGDIFAAFQDTNAALKIITNAELLTNRGVINQFMGYLNCAIRDYQQAITIDPNYALAYFNAANVYFLNKQFSQANDYYDKAIELDPQNESAFLNRAITNTLLKKFEEAKTDFEKAISLSPLSAAIYFNKANLYSMLQQYEQAEEDISKALSIQPYDALMYKLRADIRGKMGLIQEAIADYKKAISIQELINSN
ncbi:tetratricopeptide repeat protein 6 [Protobothrops mucrosquamatus]|uniref:tetratricopeptide repeat protein 6 n=1 Tax=Protobothrops mucrosquamatus TaxID=103944 RepID=UPI0010FB3069|nr:tetratricopeptide repeat protein 6 [Protobothrops mucrosquamatus]